MSQVRALALDTDICEGGETVEKPCVRFLLPVLLIGLVCTQSASAVIFDHDGDGDVDLVDYAGFYTCATAPGVPASSECVSLHDGDGDTDVDLDDFRAFQVAFGGTAPTTATKAQLAGNSLADYPFFEYVRAFNDNATVDAAIDPTLFPEVVGVTADLYVVSAKSAGGWTVDPSLIDVRNGGAQTVTLGGSSIEDNTFQVAVGGELNAYAGTGLGVGYDLVLDCNQNGVLDAADYIDGLSDEAGFFVVKDTASEGPLAVTEAIYSGGTWLGQDTYYPTDIASMGELPLVVISHGNGHDYRWYDHIWYHLASYGYVVMSHQNNTGPGSATASTTTLTNTEYIIENQDIIEGGVLNGHIDTSRIAWIGHSRGGEGVVRAHTRLRTGDWTSPHYEVEDVVLVSSMAPVTHIQPASDSTPHDVNYHMFIAGADSDVSGSASSSSSKPLAFYERAFGNKQLVYLHGCGHAWLHDGPATPTWAEGPDLIGQAASHTIVKGYYLPLVKLYMENNLVARDYFARLNDHFRPAGIPGNVVLSNYYRAAESEDKFVIDDYESQTGTGTSSSGGGVSFSVQNVVEVQMSDLDGSFNWTGSQPSNGMTMTRYSDDNPHCVVFDWNGGSSFYELDVVPDGRNFAAYTFLSFRACQGTHHPRTDALDGPLSFTATLRDSAGVSSSIDFGSMGHITRTYERSGGWANEFNTVRIRLTDFLTDASGLDLSDVVAIRFEFGSAFGSSQGRIGLDDIELINDFPPTFVPLTMSLPAPAPEFLPPSVPTAIEVEIFEGNDEVIEGTPTLHYRYDAGAWLSTPLQHLAGALWRGTLPPPACGESPEFYFSAEGDVTGPVFAPASGAAQPYFAFVGTFVSIFDDNFETDQGWTVNSDPSLTGGEWERGVPVGGGARQDPPTDFDGSGRCYLTENVAGNSDVDGGPTWITSPTFDLSATSDPVLRLAYWWANDDQDGDPLNIEVGVYDSGAGAWDWTLIETISNVPNGWADWAAHLADYVTPSAETRVRISVSDNPNNSIDEAGIDAVQVFEVDCE